MENNYIWHSSQFDDKSWKKNHKQNKNSGGNKPAMSVPSIIAHQNGWDNQLGTVFQVIALGGQGFFVLLTNSIEPFLSNVTQRFVKQNDVAVKIDHSDTVFIINTCSINLICEWLLAVYYM